MSERATGKVRKVIPDKDFRFVSRAGSTDDVFVSPTLAQNYDLAEGDEVEYEFEPDPRKPGRFRASKIITVTKAAVSAPTPSASPPRGRGPAVEPSNELAVSMRFDPRIELEATNLIRTHLECKDRRGPCAGVRVRLYRVNESGERDEVLTPSKKVATDGNGQVYFALYLDKSVERHDLVAKIGDNEYAFFWQKAATGSDTIPTGTFEADKLPAPKPAAWVPEVQRLGYVRGNYTYRVKARPSADLGLESEISLEWRVVGTSWGTTPVKVGEDSFVNVEVRVVDKGARGDAFFVVDCLRSQPQYVKHPDRPEAKDNAHV